MNVPSKPVYKTEGGVIVDQGPPLMVIQFDDPKQPELREKQIKEIADSTFDLNGIKRYWAGCDGTRCVVAGWGE